MPRKDGNATVMARNASAALATPTDLKPQEVAAIAEAVNPLIADALALYVKTKNFHWHLSGIHFRDLHLLFDEQAEQVLESVDVLAERLRKLGATTLHSIGHIGQLQTIKDDNDEFVEPVEMVRRLMEDNRHMAAAMRAAHEVCDDNRDVATASELEVLIDQTERRTWFLFETARGLEER